VPEGEGRDIGAALREVALGALARTTGSPLVEGNGVRILHDCPENYPAWEQAIASARRSVHIEMYIFRSDQWGTRFAALLAGRAGGRSPGTRPLRLVRVLVDSAAPLPRSAAQRRRSAVLQPAEHAQSPGGAAQEPPQGHLRGRRDRLRLRPLHRRFPGWAIGRAAFPPGGTWASSCAGPRWRMPSTPSPNPGGRLGAPSATKSSPCASRSRPPARTGSG